jgi:hypothetical protein
MCVPVAFIVTAILKRYVLCYALICKFYDVYDVTYHASLVMNIFLTTGITSRRV